MAESLKAFDIEVKLKAMLQLPGNSGTKDGNNTPKQSTEQAASSNYKKQRKPRKKKKKSGETEESGAGESPVTPQQVPLQQESRSPMKSNNQKQQKTPRQKNTEPKGEININEGVKQDEPGVSTVTKKEESPSNPPVIKPTVIPEQNTNQNSIGNDKVKRQKHENRPGRAGTPPKKDLGSWKGSSDGVTGEKLPNQTDPKVLEELALSGIFPLKKKSLRFPRANFFCRICEFHCDRVVNCWDHMKDRRHIRRLEISKGDKQLKDIPTPSPAHIEALTQTVTEMTEKYGLSDSEMEQRQVVVGNLQQYLQTLIPNLMLDLYGSSVTSFALKTSDANVDIILPKGQSASQALVTIYKALKERDEYTNVRSDFKAKIPSVSLDDPPTQTCYQLTVGNSQAQETTELLALYSKIDPRVRQLAIAFRFWAKICKVDQQMMGTMPAYVTTLLTVFYLQQLKPPVLPVLHEYSNPPGTKQVVNEEKKSPTDTENSYCRNIDFLRICWKGENTQSVGELWLDMVKFYSLTFSMAHDVVCIRQHKVMCKGEKKWSGKKLSVEDPFSRKRNVTRSVSSNLVFDYIYDCLRQAYRYFGTPRNSPKACQQNEIQTESQSTSEGSKKCRNDTSSSFVQGAESKVPGSDQQDSFLCEDSENTSSSRCHTGDSSDSNVFQNFATNLSNSIIDNAKVSVQENTSDLPLINSADNVVSAASSEDRMCVENSENKILSARDSSSCDDNTNSNLNDGQLGDGQDNFVGVSARVGDMPVDVIEEFAERIVRAVIRKAIYRVIGTDGMTPANDGSKRIIGAVSANNEDTPGVVEVLPSKSQASQSNESSDDQQDLKPENLKFTFSVETLTDGKGPAVVCSICQLEGHLKQACPEETLPDLPPLLEITSEHLKILSSFLNVVPDDFAPTPLEVDERNHIVSELERYIKGEYPAAKLSLFGSSRNGFGFRHSDLDICMTVDQPTAEGLDCVAIIETLSRMLKEHRGFYNVLPITTAKVPIVKFKHRHSNLEGDISLYNTLAQHNTDMLLMYAMIDKRVGILGYAMKVFAKVCDIGDASRGSLSSYGYILMVLHYLQQCKPPVIPVLQELHPPDEHPEVLVDGWNAWFFNDLQRLPEVWPDYGKNRASIAELWMGMFRYYTEKFEFREQVVCIRQLAPLTRFEKLWNGRCIAIEDPFDLSHNLGAGLSRKMNMYIQKAFIKGRLLYCTPIECLPPGYQSLGDYFFDPEKLTEEAPPTDKCCRACGKIGHFVKECPIVRNRKQREDDEKRRWREFERSPGEDRGHQGRRDNRNPHKDNGGNSRGRRDGRDDGMRVHKQDYARRPQQDHLGSSRTDPRAGWPLVTPAPKLEPYMSPGLLPRPMGQGSYPGPRAPNSPRQTHNPLPLNQHQREPLSPNSRWQTPVMPQSVFYYNQSTGSNSPASTNQSYGPQMRGQSTGAGYKYSSAGAPYQQQYTNQGRHQEGFEFHTRKYIPRDNERYDPRYGRKL